MHHVLFAIICLLWGSNFLLMKKATHSLGAVSVGAWRVTLGALVVAVIFRLRKDLRPVRARHLPHLCIVALFSYVYPFIAQPYVIAESGSSAFVGMMVSLVPLSTLVVSIPMLGIHPTRTQLIGVVGGLLFFVVVFHEGLTVQKLTLFQLLLSAGVPIGYAAVNTYIKKHLTDLPAVPLTLMSLGLAAVVLLPLSIGEMILNPVVMDEKLPVAILAMVVVGTVGTGIATILFYKLIHDHGPLFAGMVTYIIPVVAMLLAVADQESISFLQLAGMCGIFAMVALVQSRPAITSHPQGPVR